MKEILGAQFGEFRKSTKSHLIKKYLTATWTWSLIVPGFLGVFLFFTARVPEEYRLSKDILSQTLAIFLPVPLALVGLVIPFLALAVSVVYSRMGSGAVAYAMKRNRVIRIVYSALFVLGVLILIQLFTKICDALLGSDMAMDVISSIGWVVVILSTWWIIFLLILAGIGVASVLAAFSPAKALNAISKEMVTESMRTLEREFEENISLKVLEDELKDSHFEVGFFQPSDGRLITSKKIGNIANISIWGLLKINASLTPIQKAFLKIIFARPHHYIATHDSQIAGIRGDLSDSISETLFI
ncbi:MAG TPA: hypothetical protein VHP63_06050, partial [candidate division Zixibacteria bacterium]|nr:hypothetical protein [candidate division Zixibacteria bacterium]